MRWLIRFLQCEYIVVRYFVVVLVVVFVGIGYFVGSSVQIRLHNDDKCDFAQENYEIANDVSYRTQVFDAGGGTSEWEYLKDIYGEDAASEIMDARWNGTALPAAFMAGAVIEACGEAPPPRSPSSQP